MAFPSLICQARTYSSSSPSAADISGFPALTWSSVYATPSDRPTKASRNGLVLATALPAAFLDAIPHGGEEDELRE